MPVKILVADDSVTMRKVLQLTFAGEDAQVIAVDSAAAAFAQAQKDAPDVVFADLSMQGEDGYDLARKFKSTPALSRTAVIVLSSTSHHPYDSAKGSAAGVDDHLDKPFDSGTAIEKVASVLVKPRASASSAPAASSGPVQVTASSRPSKRTVAFGTPAVSSAGARPVAAQRPAPAAAQRPAPVAPAQRPAPAAPAQRPAPAAPAQRPAPVAPAQRPAPVAAQRPAPVAAQRPAAPMLELASEDDIAASRGSATAPRPQAKPAAAVAAATSAASPLAAKLEGLGLEDAQLKAILALSKEVVEQVVWEVVPEIAEAIIREEIRRLTAE